MRDIDAEKIKKLDGSLLLTLRELLRQRRATLAARRLGLSQSAISHALARLRELFGDPLFVRRPYGLEPTRHALELAPHIDALLEAMHAAMGLPSQFSAPTTTRSFRVAAPDHVTTLLAPPLVDRLATHAPHARVAFSQRLGHDAQQALLRDELDLALGRFARRDLRLVMQPLFEDRYCLVARRDHALLRKRLNPARYAQLDQVQVSVSADFRAPDFAHGDRRWRPRRTIAAVPRFLIAFAVVAQTTSVAVVPSRLARRHAPAFGLKIHPLPFELEPISVVIARNEHLDPGVAFLIEQLQLAAADA
jgi:DNA-binding transcriptional LysR family regulator